MREEGFYPGTGAAIEVTPAGYAQMTNMLNALSDGKLLSILDGGYNLRSITSSATSVMKPYLWSWNCSGTWRPQDMSQALQIPSSLSFSFLIFLGTKPLNSGNLQNADKVAGAGFLAVAPDFFYGDPVDLSNPQFDRDAWRKVHTTDKGYEDAKPVIAALKSKGVSAIGAAGFCWGGRVAVKLASSVDIQAAVLLHPSRVTKDDIIEVKVPIAILGAEIDHIAPAEQLKDFGDKLSAKAEFDSFVKIYPGVAHGWTVKYNDEDEFAVKSAEEAHEDMLNWLIKYVK